MASSEKPLPFDIPLDHTLDPHTVAVIGRLTSDSGLGRIQPHEHRQFQIPSPTSPSRPSQASAVGGRVRLVRAGQQPGLHNDRA